MLIYMLFKYDFYVKGTSSKFKFNNCANFDSKNDVMYFFQYLKKPSLSQRLQSFYIRTFTLFSTEIQNQLLKNVL